MNTKECIKRQGPNNFSDTETRALPSPIFSAAAPAAHLCTWTLETLGKALGMLKLRCMGRISEALFSLQQNQGREGALWRPYLLWLTGPQIAHLCTWTLETLGQALGMLKLRSMGRI